MTAASFTPHTVFGLDPMWVSVALLAVTYAFVVAGRPDRTVVALIGASLVILVGALDQGEAVRGIDWDTIGLLTGMMIIVSISRRSGMFQFLAVWSAQRVRANPAGILLMLQITTAILSAVLNNVSTVLLVVPVTLAIAAAGASMVGLIAHASDPRAPAAVAWLLGGSVALGLVALVVTARTLEDWDRLAALYRPLARVMVGASIAALVVAWLQPAPWLLALALVAILVGVWLFAVDRMLRLETGLTD